jgi:hypothetical protein
MKLYILIQNNGDGSSSNFFVLDPDVLKHYEDSYWKSNASSSIDMPGVDCDGFNYNTLNVPDGSTAHSLGIPLNRMLTKESINS